MKTITNGATIIVVSTGKCYHTLRDWGLAIGNNNCIGDPVLETFYLDVPGADGILDYSAHRATHLQIQTHRDCAGWQEDTHRLAGLHVYNPLSDPRANHPYCFR